MKPKILLIDASNFQDYPIGGTLTFSRNLLRAYGNQLALVGISTDDTPVGKWIEKKIDGVNYKYFSIGKLNPENKKPIIPRRLYSYVKLYWYKNSILEIGIRNIFIQSSTILIAVDKWGWDSICYRFAGIENPLDMPRYNWGRLLSTKYKKLLLKSLRNVDVILTSADESAIIRLLNDSNGEIDKNKVKMFPTRVDSDVFKPIDKNKARKSIGLSNDDLIIVTVGRINRVKGWKFLLEVFKIFRQYHPISKFYFIGDGEDNEDLKDMIKKYNLQKNVYITGFKNNISVAYYINSADLVVFGSYREGWSNAMLETIACGKPIVSTDVSGSNDMVIEGENGFVVHERNPVIFAAKMSDAIDLKNAKETSLKLSNKFSMDNLKEDIEIHWKIK